MGTDFSLFHLYDDEEIQPIRLADDGNCPADCGADSDGSINLERYDGDGELRTTETLTEYDRANL